MSSGIGVYPGGPHGPGPRDDAGRRPRLMRVEEIDALADRRAIQRGRRRRRNRVVIASVVALLIALVAGIALGRQAHRTVEEIVESQVESSVERAISAEVNRTLLELWKMEDVQYARNRPGR
jgi:hypothetical protein